MAKHFDDKDIDIFFEAWLAGYPNALQEHFRIFRTPFHPRNRRLVANNIQRMRKTAEKLDFYKAYKTGREFPFLDLQSDVTERVRSLFRSKEIPIQPFTDDQIDEIRNAMTAANPTFVKRALFEMKHPFLHIAVPDARSLQRLSDVATSFDWFSDVPDKDTSAVFRLHIQLMTKIATDAGIVELGEESFHIDMAQK